MTIIRITKINKFLSQKTYQQYPPSSRKVPSSKITKSFSDYPHFAFYVVTCCLLLNPNIITKINKTNHYLPFTNNNWYDQKDLPKNQQYLPIFALGETLLIPGFTLPLNTLISWPCLLLPSLEWARSLQRGHHTIILQTQRTAQRNLSRRIDLDPSQIVML